MYHSATVYETREYVQDPHDHYINKSLPESAIHFGNRPWCQAVDVDPRSAVFQC